MRSLEASPLEGFVHGRTPSRNPEQTEQSTDLVWGAVGPRTESQRQRPEPDEGWCSQITGEGAAPRHAVPILGCGRNPLGRRRVYAGGEERRSPTRHL